MRRFSLISDGVSVCSTLRIASARAPLGCRVQPFDSGSEPRKKNDIAVRLALRLHSVWANLRSVRVAIAEASKLLDQALLDLRFSKEGHRAMNERWSRLGWVPFVCASRLSNCSFLQSYLAATVSCSNRSIAPYHEATSPPRKAVL